jgi:mycothiol synthase
MLTTEHRCQLCQPNIAVDLPAIATLINTCQAADNLEHRTTVAKLRERYADPTFDVDQDLRLWRNGEGELMAIAELWRQPPETEFISHLGFSIHPQAQDRPLAAAILAWAEQRVLSLGTSLSVPIVLHAGCRDTVLERQQLLQRLGFEPERSFWQLQRSLTTPIPEDNAPSDWRLGSVWRLRTVVPADADRWVDMFNQTFVDHWNHSPLTLAEFTHWCDRAQYAPHLNLVIETAEGQLAAFAYSEINAEQNARLGRQEGHVCLLGTRRGYRRLGLGRTLLLESLRRLQHLGMTTASIGVDSQNPTGAVKLYQSVGFEPHKSSTVYRKVVAPPAS